MVCQQIEVNKIEAQCFKTPLKRVPKIVRIIGQKIVKKNCQKIVQIVIQKKSLRKLSKKLLK